MRRNQNVRTSFVASMVGVSFAIAGGDARAMLAPAPAAPGGTAADAAYTLDTQPVVSSFLLALPASPLPPAPEDALCTTKEWERFFTIGYMSESVELNRLDTKKDFNGASIADQDGVRRYRTGGFIRMGEESFGVDIAAYQERLVFEDFFGPGQQLRISDAHYQVGVSGSPRWQLNECWSWLIDYAGSVALGDIEDLSITEVQVRGGAGLEFAGFQGAVGVIAEFENGEFDSANLELTGTNIGGYARLGYRAKHIPVMFNVSAFFGDYEGAEFRIGVSF